MERARTSPPGPSDTTMFVVWWAFAGESRGDLDGGLRSALLFQPGVVVGGHAGELRDLLAAQSLRTPARPLGQPDVAGAQDLTPVPQEFRQLNPVHAAILAASRPAIQRPPIHG